MIYIRLKMYKKDEKKRNNLKKLKSVMFAFFEMVLIGNQSLSMEQIK